MKIKIRDLEEAIQNKNPTATSVHSESIMAEFNYRVRRAANVMVYGLAESTSSDVDTRRKADLHLTTSLFKITQPNFNNSGVKTFCVKTLDP